MRLRDWIEGLTVVMIIIVVMVADNTRPTPLVLTQVVATSTPTALDLSTGGHLRVMSDLGVISHCALTLDFNDPLQVDRNRTDQQRNVLAGCIRQVTNHPCYVVYPYKAYPADRAAILNKLPQDMRCDSARTTTAVALQQQE